MKRVFSVLSIVFVVSFLYATSSFAAQYPTWHGGIQAYSGNGISAKISTPADPLALVKAGIMNGVSSWVSTFWDDSQSNDYWMQAGWRYYQDDTYPKLYWEYCKECDTQNPVYDLREVGTQVWNSKIIYLIERSTSDPLTWCAYYSTGTYFTLMRCVPNLHPDPLYLMVNAEVHNDARNNINTLFEEVKYKDPTDNDWKSVSSVYAVNYGEFPYQLNLINNYDKFEVIRSTTNDYFAPGVTD